ncbi:hypothetical protein [Nocardia sp. NPDC052566]|uniref:hypothetical protein n=1 Tax=Nocardia sp. NPDC052566 TaxID=3364330 RepID=UPI0037CA0F78
MIGTYCRIGCGPDPPYRAIDVVTTATHPDAAKELLVQATLTEWLAQFPMLGP